MLLEWRLITDVNLTLRSIHRSEEVFLYEHFRIAKLNQFYTILNVSGKHPIFNRRLCTKTKDSAHTTKLSVYESKTFLRNSCNLQSLNRIMQLNTQMQSKHTPPLHQHLSINSADKNAATVSLLPPYQWHCTIARRSVHSHAHCSNTLLAITQPKGIKQLAILLS